MINIDYSNEIKITTGDVRGLFSPNQLPLKISVKNSVSKKVVWECDIWGNMWAVYPNSEMKDVLISDANGNYVTSYNWNFLVNGTIFYKSLWIYCKSLINRGIKPNGLVIGTHDGEFGEWVPVVKSFMSDVVLVEGSKKQFDELVENYSRYNHVFFVNNIVTPIGGDVEFFEGGLGYTNTVVKKVIDFWEKEQVTSSLKNSISINELIQQFFYNQGKVLDWIHLDVEGLDAQLLLAIDNKLLPNFIIYEDFNLDENERFVLESYLKNNGYSVVTESGISMSIKY